jgi:SAM-dependent methyltransferase
VTDPEERQAGDLAYRAYVGPPTRYDLVAASQFALLTHLGLRDHHTLLDVGCGSLRGGRLFIPYLLPERYFGLEPNAWLIEEGLDRELGRSILDVKRPTFRHDDDFSVEGFGASFDYVLAQSILSHTSRPQTEACLGSVAGVLAPGGVLVATWMAGADDHTGSDWVYPECVTYREPTMRAMAEAAGLTFTPLDWPHPNGQRWFVASRRGETAPAASELGSYVGLRERLAAAEAELARIRRSPAYRLYRGLQRVVRRRRAAG